MKVQFANKKFLRDTYPFDEEEQYTVSVDDRLLLKTGDMRDASIFYKKVIDFIEKNGALPANIKILHEYEIKPKQNEILPSP